MSDLAAGPTLPLFIAAVGIAGAGLGMVADRAVARAFPRFGTAPPFRIRLAMAATTAVLAALLAARFGAAWVLPAYLLFSVLGVQLSRIDFVHKLLPNRIVATLLVTGSIFLAVAAAGADEWGALVRAGASAVILFFFYLFLAIISPNGIGMGDVKLAAPIGMYLGYLGWNYVFYGAALGFVLGGITTVTLLRLKAKGNLREVAFGPSMLAGALGVILLLPLT